MQAERLADELKILGFECDIRKNFNLSFLSNGETKKTDYGCCVFLDKDISVARMLEKGGLRLFNSADSIKKCDDKLLTHVELADCGIPMPDSIYAPLCYYEDAEISCSFLGNAAEKLGFPLVAKKCFGSCGAGVFLIKNHDELYGFEKSNMTTSHFYQKFIGNGGEDIRVIVIGGKFVCSMKRKNAEDFRSNVELGGHGEVYAADSKLIALCEKVADILQLDYCGIDILTDAHGNRYVCEVNSNAFFAEAERLCVVNISRKYAECIAACIWSQ